MDSPVPGVALGVRRIAFAALSLVLCAIVLFAAQRLSAAFDYHSVIKTLRHLPASQLALASLATILSYCALVGRDGAGLRTLGAVVSAPLLYVGSIAGSSLGNMVGFGALTGGAVRYRVYGAGGLSAAQVARLTVLTNTTFAFALLFMSGLFLFAGAGSLAGMLATSPFTLGGIGAAILSACIAVLAWCPPDGARLRLARWTIELPGRGAVLLQIALVAIDVAGAALALFVLLPAAHVGFVSFLAIYTVALLLGVIGHTPGGLGVFEAVIMFTLGRSAPPTAVVAALLAYRTIYFLLPLLLSGALLGAFEACGIATRLAPRQSVAATAKLSQLAPMYLGVITFAIGIMLLLSGATPAFGKRLAMLQMSLPLWVVESSQLLGSVLGVLLLFVARGLLRRLDAAWWFAALIAVASLTLSLAKGLAFVEAGVLGFLILLLVATRHRFDRRASIFEQRFTLGWLVSIGIVLAATFWVFFFAYRNVPYSRELWWQFEFDETASRALRATFAASLFAIGMVLWQWLRPAAGKLTLPTAEDIRTVEQIIRAQERSDAVLAMMGDKSFLFSPSRRAFLMYAKRRRSWVALHDPIGPRSEWPALIAQFVALAHAHGARAAFYQIRPHALPLYLDAGLKLMKLGEEACVDLAAFGLEGSARTHLRYALKRGERDGLTTEVYAPAEAANLLPAMQEISNAWLRQNNRKEKRFSVASFFPDYVAAQSVIMVYQHGQPAAFATVMTTDLLNEATVGVMRYRPGTSPYAMEFLFTKLALHLKQAGFASVSLGMAPLSGLAPTPLAGWWHRVGHLLWRFGSRLYNFRGLRTFKGKFNPEWQPRYLAASGTLGPFLTLADLAFLTSDR